MPVDIFQRVWPTGYHQPHNAPPKLPDCAAQQTHAARGVGCPLYWYYFCVCVLCVLCVLCSYSVPFIVIICLSNLSKSKHHFLIDLIYFDCSGHLYYIRIDIYFDCSGRWYFLPMSLQWSLEQCLNRSVFDNYSNIRSKVLHLLTPFPVNCCCFPWFSGSIHSHRCWTVLQRIRPLPPPCFDTNWRSRPCCQNQ